MEDLSALLIDPELQEEIIKIAYPAWLRSTKDSHNFRGFVLDKHAISEHLMNLILVAYFLGSISSKKAEALNDQVVGKIDFAKKIEVLTDLGIIVGVLPKLLYKINNFRVAQSHIKKDGSLRVPSEENWNEFQAISTKATGTLINVLIGHDKGLYSRVENSVKKLVSKLTNQPE